MSITHLNLNDRVKVKITETGKKYLRQKNIKLATDKEGFLDLSLWEFSGIFGDAFQAPTLNPPVEPNIVLLVENQLISELQSKEPAKIGIIAICALRYAARPIAQTESNNRCIDGIKYYWELISAKERQLIVKDLKEAIEREGVIGFPSIWHDFYQLTCDSQQLDIAIAKNTYLGELTIFAIRYCFERITSKSSLIIDTTKENWHLLSAVDRAAIKNEVRLAIKTRSLGMEYDRWMWDSFDCWLAENS
jgi:hypothetical protein